MDQLNLLAAIVNSSTDPIYCNDLSGTILTWNRAAEKLLGYSASEIIGQNIYLLVPESRRNEKKLLENLLWGHEIKSFQTQRQHKSGRLVNVSLTLSPVLNSEGKTIAVSSVLREVPEQQRAEAKAEALLESAPDAMVIVNKFGQIVLVNAQTEKLFGFDRAELIGQEVEVLMPERYRARHLNHRGIFFSHPKTREMGQGTELYGRKRDGAEFPVEISLSPLQIEEGVFVSAAIRDITGRKKEEQKFRGLLESAPDAMVIVNKNGIIQLVNSQTEKIFGFSRGEIIGKPVEILIPDEYKSAHPEHRASFFGSPKVRGMGVGLELYGKRKDQTTFPVEISLSPIETEEGLLVAAAIRDITGQKKAAQELKDYAARLEMTNKELESFTYIASHDLKEPLRKVQIYSDMICSQDQNRLTPESIANFNRIISAVDRMRNLIDDLLMFSSVVNIEEEFHEVDLNRVLGEVLQALNDTVREKQAQVKADHLPVVRGVHFQLRQVFENILLNSMKYVNEGTAPDIRICYERVKIPAKGLKSAKASCHRISISDNGIGFAPEYATRVFQLFQRLHHGSYPGTGIGLAIVKRIINNHEGTIIAHSREGSGTTMVIELPGED